MHPKRFYLIVFLLTLLLCSLGQASSQSGQAILAHPPPEGKTAPQEAASPRVIEQLKELPAEVPTPINTEKIDQAGKEFGQKLMRASQNLAPIFGDWIKAKPIWDISWFFIGSCALLLALVVTGERLLRFIISRWLSRRKQTTEEQTWGVLLVQGISHPLSLILIVYGGYGALSPLLPFLLRQNFGERLALALTWGTDLAGSIGALWFLYRLVRLASRQVIAWAQRQQGWFGTLLALIAKRSHLAINLLVLILFSRLISPLFTPGPTTHAIIGQIFGLLMIFTITWITIEILHSVEEVFLSHYRMDVEDNLAARKMHTQVQFIKRMAITLVIVLAGASMLMLFDKVRQLGTSILASAGIIGLVVGLAAQRSISNILVGLQIALTQPIRLDDAVVVENEWGRIEEITTTYVVVKLWDLRRLVVPISYFTEKPFQNWTRGSAEILGTVYLYTDYTIPVSRIREKLRLILEDSLWWNGKLSAVHVTNTSPQGMELRILVSADNAGAAWDLRCHIREQMITFLQTEFPECLPRIRTELQSLVPTGKETI